MILEYILGTDVKIFVSFSDPGTIRPILLSYFKHEYEGGGGEAAPGGTSIVGCIKPPSCCTRV